MRQWCGLSAVLFLVMSYSGNLRAEDAAKKPPAVKEVTITGTFTWTGKKNAKNDLKVVLTPDVAGSYKAVYTFKWGKGDQTWQGTLKGGPQDGDVSGTGATPDGNRQFVFKGKAAGGVLTCKHFEVVKGKETLTGDLTLKF